MKLLEVNIFIPCFVDQLYPQTGLNMVKVLKKANCRVQYNPNQTCCGQPAYNAGFFIEAGQVGRKFVQDFNTDTFHYIVAPSASCVGMVKNGYKQLEALGHMENVEGLHRIQPRMYELSDFLVNVLQVNKIPGAKYYGKVAYHDSCSGLRECGIKKEPRELLKNVAGLQLLELPDSETCCGFGGTFAVKFEAISVGMAQQKVNNALSIGADTIASTDSSCLMHMEAYIKKENLPLKVRHLADILASEE